MSNNNIVSNLICDICHGPLPKPYVYVYCDDCGLDEVYVCDKTENSCWDVTFINHERNCTSNLYWSCIDKHSKKYNQMQEEMTK